MKINKCAPGTWGEVNIDDQRLPDEPNVNEEAEGERPRKAAVEEAREGNFGAI